MADSPERPIQGKPRNAPVGVGLHLTSRHAKDSRARRLAVSPQFETGPFPRGLRCSQARAGCLMGAQFCEKVISTRILVSADNGSASLFFHSDSFLKRQAGGSAQFVRSQHFVNDTEVQGSRACVKI